MRVLLLVLLLVLVSCQERQKEVDNSQLQYRNDTYYVINDDKPFTGKTIGYYKNGQIKIKANLKNGKLHGESTSYYENGQIKAFGIFKDGKPDGENSEYYEDGKIKAFGVFKDGVLVK